MTDTEVVYDDGANTYMITGQAAQDLRDGAALRRLREALPDDAVGFEMGAWVRREDDPQYPGWGFRIDAEWWTDDEPRFHSANGRGATIAEAADACRAALSGPPSGTRPEAGTAR